MITGKNKEQFEKWFGNTIPKDKLSFHLWADFDELPFEMQIGVYLAYYDSLGIKILIDYGNDILWHYVIDINDFGEGCGDFNTRNEAYKEALKKADDLINNQ